jgi:methyl-accepting chemotaxis protein
MPTSAVASEAIADRALRTRLLQALAVIVLPLVLLIGLETYQIVTRGPSVTHNRDQVIRTFRVIAAAQALDRALQDAERGQRGYLITGANAYLDPYHAGARDAPGLLAQLKLLTADNADQQNRVAELLPQVSIKLDELAASVAVRQQRGFEAARAIVQNDTGLNSMRAITTLLDSLIAHENALLTERLTRTGEDEQASANVALLGRHGGVRQHVHRRAAGDPGVSRRARRRTSAP